MREIVIDATENGKENWEKKVKEQLLFRWVKREGGKQKREKTNAGAISGGRPFLPHCGLHLRLLDCR